VTHGVRGAIATRRLVSRLVPAPHSSRSACPFCGSVDAPEPAPTRTLGRSRAAAASIAACGPLYGLPVPAPEPAADAAIDADADDEENLVAPTYGAPGEDGLAG
jgi:hypothetical protein